MENAFNQEVDEVAAFFDVDVSKGLSDTNAGKLRATYGSNEFEPEEGTPLWKLVLKQFDDTLVKILLVAAIVDFIIAISDGETFLRSLVEPMVILLILVANAVVGVVTERNAEQAIEELKAYEAEAAAVLRDGALQQIPASQLVPGDVVEVAVGTKVPADIRLFVKYTSVLRVDQSILTGESGSVDKTPDVVPSRQAVLQDKTNILFSGTMVTNGRGRGIVVATGSSTAIGHIRGAIQQQEDEVTPLKQKLDEFGELLSRVIAAICVMVWLMNIGRFTDPALGGFWHGAIYYFKIAVALAVAAIPEGLPAVVTTCLALGTRKMAQRNAIVRTLPAVETLGCTSVIATDKTGTLTTNQMSVVRAAVVDSSNGALAEFEVTGNTFSPEGTICSQGGAVLNQPADSPTLLQLANCGCLCNDSTLAPYRPSVLSSQQKHVGEATELALRVFAEKVGLPVSMVVSLSEQERGWPGNEFWQGKYQRVASLEFSRDRKMMSVLCAGQGQTTLFVKGAPESIIQRCTHMLVGSGQGVVPLSTPARTSITATVESYCSDSLRVLALASKPMPKNASTVAVGDESGLTFLGLVAMHDPPREECRVAVATCQQAGIRVVMVTGDNPATATAVGQRVGIVEAAGPKEGEKHCMTGAQFDSLTPTEQVRAVQQVSVFSRVEPLHKLKLVELLKAQGQIVAMTGDGVNDAPALVRADIGVAMGSGTAVAKGAADMVLADDNFATIVAAVAEGRAIYANTKQFIRYMISSNIGEVVAIFVAAALGIPEVLTPVQLLWVNLVTDGLPATALGFNKPDPDIMQAPPRRPDESIVDSWLFIRYLLVGLYVGLATVYGFVWWFVDYKDGPQIRWQDLSHFQTCQVDADLSPASTNARHLLGPPHNFDCSIFSSKHPKTISMSVLVIVEMFNALNNLSENSSILTITPLTNMWLLGAIAVSVVLHLFILYVPPAAAMFGVTALTQDEWLLVLLVSAPVVLLDEVLKFVSRRYRPKRLGRTFSKLLPLGAMRALEVDLEGGGSRSSSPRIARHSSRSMLLGWTGSTPSTPSDKMQ